MGIHPQGVRLLELKRQRRGVKWLQAQELALPSNDESKSPQLEMLQYAKEQFKLSRVRVLIQLPPADFRHHLVTLPEQAREPDIAKWVDKNLINYLPPGLSKSQVIYGYNVIQSTESTVLLLTIARRSTVEPWLLAAKNINLRLIGLSGNVYPVLIAFAFRDSAFYDENRAYLHHDGKTITYMMTQQGNLVQYQDFPHESDGSHAWITQKNKFTSCPQDKHALDRLVTTGEEIRLEGGSLAGVKTEWGGKLLLGHISAEKAPHYILLFGLGIQSLFALSQVNDLLPRDFRNAVARKEEQIQTRHFGALLFLTLVALWLVLLGANLFLKRELQAAHQQVARLDTRIKQIEALKNTGRKLSEQLNLRQDILDQRSQLARTLFDISQIMPEGVWLRELRFGHEPDAQKSQDVSYILQGLALGMSGPGQLLSAMEKIADFSKVQLDYLQSIPAEVVFRKTKLRKKSLTKFKIRAWKNING